MSERIGFVPLIGLRILLIEHDRRIADFIVRCLTEEDSSVVHAAAGPVGWIEMQRGGWD
jgi:hypothetical protein